METKSASKFGKKDLLTFGLVAGFFFLFYYMYSNRDLRTQKRKLKDLPQPLQDAYKVLNDKGYNPETSPASLPNLFVEFKLEDVTAIINDKNNVIISYDSKQPPFVGIYSNGLLANSKTGVVLSHSTDIVNAALEVILNKEYKS